MDSQTARTTLDEVDRLRSDARHRLDHAWFPLILFGLLTLASAGVVALFGESALGLFWLVAGVGGGIACGWHAQRTEERRGLSRPGLPYVLLAGVLLVSALLLGAFGTGAVQVAGPPLVVAVAYLGFAVLERSVAIAVTAAFLGAATIAIAVIDVAEPTIWLALLFGVAFTTLGVIRRACA